MVMTDEDRSFCPRCGADLPPGSAFCPGCGASQGSGPNPYRDHSQTVQNPLKVPMVLTAVYGLVAVVLGLISMLMALTMTESLLEEIIDQFPEWESMLTDVDIDALRSESIISGVLAVISGACALFAYRNMKVPEKWMVTIVLLVVASFTSYTMIAYYSVVIGLLVTFLVYTKKDHFTS